MYLHVWGKINMKNKFHCENNKFIPVTYYLVTLYDIIFYLDNFNLQ